MYRSTTGSLLALAGTATLVLASAASAGVISDPFIRVIATNGAGTDSFDVALADTTTDGSGTFFQLPIGTSITLSNGVVINGLGSRVRAQSGTLANLISLDINVTSGLTDTTFQVYSALFDIAPNIFNGARATAGLSLTDVGEDPAAASFTGAGPGGSAFYAVYDGQAPAGSPAAALFLGVQSTPNGGSFSGTSQTAGFPAYIPLPTAANSMSSQWNFILSAGDSAGVTSAYSIVPAPGALSLIGLAGLVSFGRRRRK